MIKAGIVVVKTLFVVVRFIEEDEDDEIVSEIPSNWLDGDDYCWWPRTKKDKSSLIAKMVPPDKFNGKWEKCQIEIKHQCSTYEKARKVAENDMSESSDSETRKGRGLRKKIPKCHTDVSDTSADEIYTFDFPEFPENMGSIPEHSTVCQSLAQTPAFEKHSREASLLEIRSSSINNSQVNVGGTNLKEKIIRVLKKILSNELAAQTSWLGQRNNFKMSNLLLTSTIKEVLINAPDFNEKLFEEVFSEWLRQAKQRFRRESQNVA